MTHIQRRMANLRWGDKTIESYIYDAAKYNRSTVADGTKISTKKVILHVEKKGNLSKKVLEYTEDKGVEIVDDISAVLN